MDTFASGGTLFNPVEETLIRQKKWDSFFLEHGGQQGISKGESVGKGVGGEYVDVYGVCVGE